MSENSENKLRDLYRSEYVAHFEKHHASQSRRVRGILNHIPLDKKDAVCDFACGNGLVADLLHNRVKEYYGVDFSEEFIGRIQQKIDAHPDFSNVHVFAEDIRHFCAKRPSFFDKAFTFDFSEHIYDAEFIEIYTAIRHTLKEKGKLYLHTPNGDFLIEIFKNRGIMKQFPEHVAVRTPKAYVKLLNDIGYKNIRLKFIPHYNVLKHLHFLSFLPLIGRFFKARILIECSK